MWTGWGGGGIGEKKNSAMEWRGGARGLRLLVGLRRRPAPLSPRHGGNGTTLWVPEGPYKAKLC